MRSSLLTFLLILSFAVSAANLQQLSGHVVRVVDGDTLVIEAGDERHKVRLGGIDAPNVANPGVMPVHANYAARWQARTSWWCGPNVTAGSASLVSSDSTVRTSTYTWSSAALRGTTSDIRMSKPPRAMRPTQPLRTQHRARGVAYGQTLHPCHRGSGGSGDLVVMRVILDVLDADGTGHELPGCQIALRGPRPIRLQTTPSGPCRRSPARQKPTHCSRYQCNRDRGGQLS